jgi:hypothetical protein
MTAWPQDVEPPLLLAVQRAVRVERWPQHLTAWDMASSRASTIANCAFVLSGVLPLQAVAIVASALLEADCRSFRAARCGSLGRTIRSIHSSCHL